MKAKPKSCSCQQCQYGKRKDRGHLIMKQAERTYRHATKIALKQGKEDIAAIPSCDRIS